MAVKLVGREMRRAPGGRVIDSGIKIKMEGEQVIEEKEPSGLRAERYTGSLGQEIFWNHPLTVRNSR